MFSIGNRRPCITWQGDGYLKIHPKKIAAIIKKNRLYNQYSRKQTSLLRKNTHFGIVMPRPEQDSGVLGYFYGAVLIRQYLIWQRFVCRYTISFLTNTRKILFTEAGKKALQADISGFAYYTGAVGCHAKICQFPYLKISPMSYGRFNHSRHVLPYRISVRILSKAVCALRNL